MARSKNFCSFRIVFYSCVLNAYQFAAGALTNKVGALRNQRPESTPLPWRIFSRRGSNPGALVPNLCRKAPLVVGEQKMSWVGQTATAANCRAAFGKRPRSSAWMRLRGSGIIVSERKPAKSPGARRRTPGGSLESSRLAARCLNSRALALLRTRRDCAQRSCGDGHHRSLLLIGRQVLYELAVGFL